MRLQRHLADAMVILATLLGIAEAASASAGTLCGTVRDARTQAPVPQAGVFVRTTAGAYTGLYAATDTQGSFCIDPIPPGSYDLEVRVDDYLVAVLKGVVVTQQTGVGITVPSDRLVHLAIWPNPAIRDVHLQWSLPRESTVRIAVYDAQGRPVAGWNGTQPAGGHDLTWDLRDTAGRTVVPGVYFVRLKAGNSIRLGRILKLQ